MLSLIAAAVLAASPPLEEAKGHLKAGRIDDVFFALDGKTVADADKPEAAKVLADAGKRALGNKDGVMALQLARMAIKLQPDAPLGLEIASRASRALDQFGDAESLADRWLKVEPQSTEAAVWRADLACDAGDWSMALSLLDTVKTKSTATARAKELRARAENELAARQTGLSGLRQLERDLARAQAASAASAGDIVQTAMTGGGDTGGKDVIIYGTSWCGYCKKAKAYFKEKKIPVIEKDVEKDPQASAELVAKAQKAGMQVRGVPVIDLRGRLIAGFDRAELDELIGRGR